MMQICNKNVQPVFLVVHSNYEASTARFCGLERLIPWIFVNQHLKILINKHSAAVTVEETLHSVRYLEYDAIRCVSQLQAHWKTQDRNLTSRINCNHHANNDTKIRSTGIVYTSAKAHLTSAAISVSSRFMSVTNMEKKSLYPDGGPDQNLIFVHWPIANLS